MMAKPMKTLELHYPMIQFLISADYTVRSAHLWLKNAKVELTSDSFAQPKQHVQWFRVMQPLGAFALVFAFHTIVFCIFSINKV